MTSTPCAGSIWLGDQRLAELFKEPGANNYRTTAPLIVPIRQLLSLTLDFATYGSFHTPSTEEACRAWRLPTATTSGLVTWSQTIDDTVFEFDLGIQPHSADDVELRVVHLVVNEPPGSDPMMCHEEL